MTDPVDEQAPLEAVLKDEILRMYQEVADNPRGSFHFFHGREAAELFGYAPEWLDRAPASAVDSFAGVGNPHECSNLQPGETVLDLGSGAGLDAIIASWCVGPSGKVIGVDLSPAMCLKVQAHAAATGTQVECQVGRMEPVESAGLSRRERCSGCLRSPVSRVSALQSYHAFGSARSPRRTRPRRMASRPS